MSVKTSLKRLMSVSLCIVLLICTVPLAVSAQDSAKQGELNIICYNVSGIPIIGGFQGSARLSDKKRAAALGEKLNSSGADIIGVEEDFNYHPYLAEKMTEYDYYTFTKGRIPFGDGINVFSKRQIYNVQRIKWDKTYGVLSGSMDRLAEKGIVWSVAEIAHGVYIDLFVVHCDAGRDRKSIEARKDNFRQIAQLVNSREYDRPAIVMGDFNSTFERNTAENIYENLMKAAGLKDTWAELYNDGDYTYENGENWNPETQEYVDRILYKDGGGVHLELLSGEYIKYTDDNGDTFTDHNAVTAGFSFTASADVENTQTLTVQQQSDTKKQLLSEVGAFFKMILLSVLSLHELLYLITQIGDYI